MGRREGRDEGRAEGEITGMKKAKMQLAVKLLQAGNSVAYVADLTELPEETVQKLSRQSSVKMNRKNKHFTKVTGGLSETKKPPTLKSLFS